MFQMDERVNISNLSMSAGDYAGRASFGAKQVILHPKYNRRAKQFDVALVKLDRTIEESRCIQYARLPKCDAELGKKCSVTGYGVYDMQDGRSSDALRVGTVSITSKRDCNHYWSYSGLSISDHQICA